MKAILMSIKPKYVAKILNGDKTIEIRKTMPKCDLPIDVYIYCTNGKETLAINPYGGYAIVPNKYHNEYFNGKVVAKFTLNKMEEIICNYHEIAGNCYDMETMYEPDILRKSCLQYYNLDDYLQGKNGYAYHIDNLVIFDKPKEIGEFKRCTEKVCIYSECHKYMHCLKSLTRAPQSWCYTEV